MSRDIYDEAKRLLDHARKPQALEDAERAVIEAAEAQLAAKDEAMPVWITATTKTERAVEALQAAREVK